MFNVSLEYLKIHFRAYSLFDLITSLRNIIYYNIVIRNKYGIKSYLREENNIFFTVDSITNENNYFSNYYNKIPTLVEDINYENLLNN